MYGVNVHIQSICGKIQTRKALNTEPFHAVIINPILDNAPILYLMKTQENLMGTLVQGALNSILTSLQQNSSHVLIFLFLLLFTLKEINFLRE